MKKEMRGLMLMVTDVFLLSVTIVMAYFIRFEGFIPDQYLPIIRQNILVTVMIKIVILYFFKLYSSLWIYASVEEMMQIIMGTLLANAGAVLYLVLNQVQIPRSIYIIVLILDMMALGGFRMSYRILRRAKKGNLFSGSRNNKRVLVIGAGDAGVMVIREMKRHEELMSKPIALIDDDEMKKGMSVNGVPVLGTRRDIFHIVKTKKIDEIIIAIPSATKKDIRDIVRECKNTGAKIKILPGVYELLDGNVTISQIREVEIEDLLGREEIHLETQHIDEFLNKKTVMVTGAAGSIGSELVHQIIKFKPNQVVLFDINENGLYNLQQELKQHDIQLTYIIASVRDLKRLDYIFNKYKPQVVFHAAAHKHVPLMEDSPYEAVKNNVFGTWNLAMTSDKHQVEKFVLISTDKAVNPTNVMGATKRICEMIVQSYNNESQTEFAAVRFGNVLGSNGSVIPLFKKQIQDGGPVTVTHPDIIRYFMTIPEAAQLVMQAGAMAKGGEIFVLDMGEPVRIMDLAEDLIRLSGLKPYDDIDIKVTGLRKGEKLYEELLLNEEGIQETRHHKIFVGKPVHTDIEELRQHLETLRNIVNQGKPKDIRLHLKTLVPEYQYKP